MFSVDAAWRHVPRRASRTSGQTRYQLGAAKTLYEAGVARPSRPIAGASSGGIVAVVASLSESGSPSLDECFESALRVNSYCRERAPSARGLLYHSCADIRPRASLDACREMLFP